MSWAPARARRSSAPDSEARSRPAKRMLPDVGSIRRSASRPTVDLPQPDSPTSASVSPASTESETPSTACATAVGTPSSERRTTKCFVTLSRASSGTLMTGAT